MGDSPIIKEAGHHDLVKTNLKKDKLQRMNLLIRTDTLNSSKANN